MIILKGINRIFNVKEKLNFTVGKNTQLFVIYWMRVIRKINHFKGKS